MMYYNPDEEEDGFGGDEFYEECEVCHQEYHGACPINSADCPYAEDDDEDDLTDFDEDPLIKDLIGDDEEIEKIIGEEVEIPVEDLVDEETSDDDDGEITPSKTVEELEAEAYEQAQLAKKKRRADKAALKASTAKKAAPAKKTPAKKKTSAPKPAAKAPAKKKR